jgi:hypothetical protein
MSPKFPIGVATTYNAGVKDGETDKEGGFATGTSTGTATGTTVFSFM